MNLLNISFSNLALVALGLIECLASIHAFEGDKLDEYETMQRARVLAGSLSKKSNETVVDIGNVRPEGTHALSATDANELGLDEGYSYILVTEAFYGGVNVLNTDTLEYTNIVPSAGYLVRGGLGVTYTQKHIIVAGLGPFQQSILPLPFEINIYDPFNNGDIVATCTGIDGEAVGAFNDIDVIDDIAYVTDSSVNRLWSFNVSLAIKDGGCSDLAFEELDPDVFLGSDEQPIRANGIVSYKEGFVVSTFSTGGLYYIETTNNITKKLIEPGKLTLPDGLELVTEDDGSKTLYVTEGGNQISVYDLKSDASSLAPTLKLKGVIKSDYYFQPGTSAVVGDMIWTANLGDTSVLPAPGEEDLEFFNTTFTVVGINRFAFEGQSLSGEGDTESVEKKKDDEVLESDMSAASKSKVQKYNMFFFIVGFALIGFII